MFRHIVLFRVHDDVSDQRVAAALDELRSLSVLTGVRHWRVELSLDARKGRVIVEDATFVDEPAFEAFRRDPRHVAVAEAMSAIADWWNGDYAA
ncbi:MULTISPECIES: Dabb family protein [Microbacterium]|uniref:Sulfite reductase, beta subunit n=1 Tax=Microbacterium hominis TaxID=162426 RepID=A0A2K9DAM5_9MICO|nr:MULTISPECIES: Dabb family protein [Microbacterium]AUG30640.1 sulfite reductase, beta subunit [Microbacterium hominis]